MQFRAEQYFQASLERMRQAREVYSGGESYALVVYLGGLAVESMLRAFRWTKDTSFEGRHDLLELLASSGLLEIDSDQMQRKGLSEDAIRQSYKTLKVAMNEIASLWHNNLRFASEATLKAHLINLRRVKGIKGDPLKKNALDLIEAARTVVDRGITLWTSPTRSSAP